MTFTGFVPHAAAAVTGLLAGGVASENLNSLENRAFGVKAAGSYLATVGVHALITNIASQYISPGAAASFAIIPSVFVGIAAGTAIAKEVEKQNTSLPVRAVRELEGGDSFGKEAILTGIVGCLMSTAHIATSNYFPKVVVLT